MPTNKKEKKFDPNHTPPNKEKKKPPSTSWNQTPSYVPVVVSTWNSSPEICFGDFSLDSAGEDGGGADDEDNLAFTKITESFHSSSGCVGDATPTCKPSVFRFSQSFPGGVKASWRVLKIGKNLFVLNNKTTSFNKECFISLLEYAEEVLKCELVYVLLPKQDNHAHRPLLQSYRFMGFTIVSPSTPPVASCVYSLGYLVLQYYIDTSDSSDDEDGYDNTK